MNEPIFTSEITVVLIDRMGSDEAVYNAALASTKGALAVGIAERVADGRLVGLIDALVRQRHGTPSEHGALTMFAHAPAAVWWEWIRHRVGQTISCPGLSDDVPDASFNLESGRYKKLDPVFWIPRPSRGLIRADDHKPIRPHYVPASFDVHASTVHSMKRAYTLAWEYYNLMLGEGIANEVARNVIGFGVYYSGWITCNPRSLMSFLSLRTGDDSARFRSYPLAEIDEAARVAESFLAEHWPVTYRAFVKNGRVAP